MPQVFVRIIKIKMNIVTIRKTSLAPHALTGIQCLKISHRRSDLKEQGQICMTHQILIIKKDHSRKEGFIQGTGTSTTKKDLQFQAEISTHSNLSINSQLRLYRRQQNSNTSHTTNSMTMIIPNLNNKHAAPTKLRTLKARKPRIGGYSRIVCAIPRIQSMSDIEENQQIKITVH